jgi:branched-chain amino acid transport system substrate-binding protein
MLWSAAACGYEWGYGQRWKGHAAIGQDRRPSKGRTMATAPVSFRSLCVAASGIAVLVAGCQGGAAPSQGTSAPSQGTSSGAPSAQATTAASALALESCKIGATYPLSGSLSVYAEQFLEGVDLAIEQINSSGGAGGQPLELILEDTQGDTQTAVTAAQKLVSVDQVPILSTVFTGPTYAQLPVIEESGTVLISPAQQDTFPDESEWAFRHGNSNTNMMSVLVDYIDEQGYQTISISGENSDSGAGSEEAFMNLIEPLDVTVVAREVRPVESTDFRNGILRLVGANPDAVLLLTSGGSDAPVFINQLREVDADVPLLTVNGIQNQGTLDVAGDAAEGLIFAAPGVDTSLPEYQAFEQAYHEKYGSDKVVQYQTANFYDMVFFIRDAVASNGCNPEGIRDGLLAMQDYPGVTGTNSYLPNGEIERDAFLWTVNDGAFVMLDD